MRISFESGERCNIDFKRRLKASLTVFKSTEKVFSPVLEAREKDYNNSL